MIYFFIRLVSQAKISLLRTNDLIYWENMGFYCVLVDGNLELWGKKKFWFVLIKMDLWPWNKNWLYRYFLLSALFRQTFFYWIGYEFCFEILIYYKFNIIYELFQFKFLLQFKLFKFEIISKKIESS